ncbi:uncharacterized protein LOC122035934 [Zingiber officinale]|uniref:Uncharacterized protein n=1 Tax=Zingiber officinale TaxID=94328 RepID=A0A8J5ENE0_ZINOF|nr:uncharacterized protein LOC122035934 [Zingiber officinale]KAG6467566.1 hypothetical protein ZIOFF_074596 [Zingiber officinale]
MATNLLSPTILPPTNPRLRRPLSLAARASSPVPSSGDAKRRWWAPLFRSIFGDTPVSDEEPKIAGETADAATESSERRPRLTTEKAKMLRREMRATETFHDAMYHSAIASRLASPDQEI